jgi:hypothetical protein
LCRHAPLKTSPKAPLTPIRCLPAGYPTSHRRSKTISPDVVSSLKRPYSPDTRCRRTRCSFPRFAQIQ